MASKRATAWCLLLYTRLLRLYPKPYRERFGEAMEQTFHDLSRERASAGDGLLTFALRTFGDTFIGIVREYLFSASLSMQYKNIARLSIITALLLLIPVLGNRFVEGWNWTAFDFVFAGAMIFGAGLAYELIAKRSRNTNYRAAFGLGLAGAFLLIWINGAVGIIGSENNPANMLYAAVLATGFLGSILSLFRPRGMMHTLFASAFVQLLVPVVALMMWQPAFSPDVVKVFVLNAGFAMLFIGSGLLFRQAARKQAAVTVVKA